MDQKCQKMSLVVTCHNIQTQIFSGPLASFLRQVGSQHLFTSGRQFVFKNPEEYSVRRSWNLD